MSTCQAAHSQEDWPCLEGGERRAAIVRDTEVSRFETKSLWYLKLITHEHVSLQKCMLSDALSSHSALNSADLTALSVGH